MISVVMPCYNCEKALDRAITSLCAQTAEDWELIAVDDGSTDRTGAALDAWAGKDTRIQVLHQANGGVSRARNAGIAAAKGEWLAFLDADDELPEDALETLLALYTGKEDILCGAYTMRCTDEGGREEPLACRDGDRQTVMESLVRTDSALNPVYAKLYRRKLIQEKKLCLPVGVKIGEDVLFNLRAFDAAQAWRMTEKSVYFYDYGGDSAMTRANRNVYESAKPMLDGITAFIRGKDMQTALFRAHIDIYLRTLRKDRGRWRAALAFDRGVAARVTDGVDKNALSGRERLYYTALRLCPPLSVLLP